MDPEETTEPDRRAPVPAAAPSVNVNVNGRNGLGRYGLTGIWERTQNYSAMTIVTGLFVAVTIWNRWDARADRTADRAERAEERSTQRVERAEERTLFRESLKEGNAEQNRRTGEVKGAVDKNTDVMRELIAEMRSAKHEGRAVPQSAIPKVPPR